MLTDEFRKAKSPSIIYEGKNVLLFDKLDVPEKGKMLLKFLESDSEWKQGVRIGDMSPNTDLQLNVAGQKAPGMQLWKDTCPPVVEIDFIAPKKTITVYNIWDTGNGQSRSQLMGAGMHLEDDDEKQRVYNCNDGHPETTFSHLKFSLEIVPE